MTAATSMPEIDDDGLPPRLSFSLTRTETTLDDDEQQQQRAATRSGACSSSSDSSAWVTRGMTSAQIHETFLSAEHFVSVVLSRLQKDPVSVAPAMWALQDQTNKLWALKQQALLGSCEESRGTKAHAQAAGSKDTSGSRLWRPCCFRMMGESKLRLWQNLGDMPSEQAKVWFVQIVTDIAPAWRTPLRTNSALLRTWTPDNERDQCTICDEAFTFLNRRHHCRRCLNLVCAVCSPHAMPLRVFTQNATATRQRICVVCFKEMEQISQAQAQHAKENHTRRVMSLSEPTDEDSLLGGSAVYPYSEDQDDEAVDANSTETKQTAAPSLTPSSSFLSSATIHSGVLDFFHGSGFRKAWHSYFFVLLIRKGSLGMFLQAQDHVEQKKRPAAVFKLSGYSLRVKSQKRRPHQFRVTHPTKKVLQFAATCIADMNAWITQFTKAIDMANELEALTQTALPTRATSLSENDFAQVANEDENDAKEEE